MSNALHRNIRYNDYMQYYLFENFIDKEYAKNLAKFFLENMHEDRREFYGFYPIQSKNYFFTEDTLVPLPYDPERIINKAIEFAHDFFLKNYKMLGDFELHRSHGNLMFEKAQLDVHKDDETLGVDENDLPNRTYVLGIFLNDDYEGGEITFPEVNESLKPSAGSLLLFPGFRSPHGVNEIKSGVRINILADFFDITDKDNIIEEYKIP